MTVLRFTLLVIRPELQLASPFSVPEFLLIGLLNVLVMAYLNLAVVFEIKSTVGDFVESVCERCVLICRLHLIVAKLFVKFGGRGTHESILH